MNKPPKSMVNQWHGINTDVLHWFDDEAPAFSANFCSSELTVSEPTLVRSSRPRTARPTCWPAGTRELTDCGLSSRHPCGNSFGTVRDTSRPPLPPREWRLLRGDSANESGSYSAIEHRMTLRLLSSAAQTVIHSSTDPPNS